MGNVRGPGDGGNRRGWLFAAGPVVLMALALAAYLILHSPLRGTIDRILGGLPACYSFCQRNGESIIASQSASIVDIAAALAAGYALSGMLRFRSLERVVAFGLLTFAFVSVPAALVGGLGDVIHLHLLHPPWGPVLSSLPALATIGFLLFRGWRPSMPRFALVRISPLAVVLAALAGGMLVISAAISIHHPPTGYDELGYHAPLAVFFWADGSLTQFMSRFPGAWPLAQPGSAELWFGLLRIIGGEPLAVLGQLPFAFLGAVGVAAFGRRLGLSGKAALLASLAFLLVPIVAIQVGRISDDVIGAALVIGAAALAAAPRREWTVGRVAVLGLTLGVMMVTKLALLPAAVALGLVVLWTITRRDPFPEPGPAETPLLDARRSRLLRVGLPLAGALCLLAVAPWWLRNLIMFANPLYPSSLPLYGHGISQTLLGLKDRNHVPAGWLWPFYPLFEPHRHDSGIGTVFAVAIVPAGLIALFRARRRPLAIIAVLALISLPAWWLESRHEPRFLLGLFGLLIAVVPFVVAGVRRSWQTWTAAILAVAAACSVVITLSTDIAIEAHYPVDRIHFYNRLWRVDPTVMELPESDGILLDDQCGKDTFNRIYPILGAGQSRSVARVACGLPTDQVVAALRRYHLSYVYAIIDVPHASDLDARYPSTTFQLVSQSFTHATKGGSDLDRRLYHLVGATP